MCWHGNKTAMGGDASLVKSARSGDDAEVLSLQLNELHEDIAFVMCYVCCYRLVCTALPAAVSGPTVGRAYPAPLVPQNTNTSRSGLQ